MTPIRNPLEVPLVWPTFAVPELLALLVVPVLLLIWVWSNRWLLPQRRLVLPVDSVRSSSGWILWTLVTLAESLPPLLLVVGIFILAGPQRSGPPQEKRSLTNIQFAVDVSGSMTSPFGEGTIYDEAMKSVNAFVDYRKGDAFGLTFFGVAYVHWVPLTSDPSALKCAPPFMRPEIAPPGFGGTAIANALKGCKKELVQREEGDRMIILISDGYSYDLAGAEAELAKEFNDASVTVFTVIVGDSPLQDEIITICRATGGEAFSAGDPEALKTIFKRIDTMKQAKMESTFVDTIDYFEPFAIVGAVLILLYALTLLGLRYTPW